jgi:ParB family chromosome partitioning protein
MELKKLKAYFEKSNEVFEMGNVKEKKSSLIKSENKKGRMSYISIYDIKENPYQPRKHFRLNEVELLAEGIKKDGLIQPIAVQEEAGSYVLIAGQKRLKAFSLLNEIEKADGLETFEMRYLTIPAFVFEAKDLEQSDIVENARRSLAENLSREDPFILDTAIAISEHYGLMKSANAKLSQNDYAEEVRESFGIESRGTIAKYLSIAKMEEEVKEAVYQHELNAFTILYQISKSKDSIADKIHMVEQAAKGELVSRDFEKGLKELNDEDSDEMVFELEDEHVVSSDFSQEENNDISLPSSFEDESEDESGEGNFIEEDLLATIKNGYKKFLKASSKDVAIAEAIKLKEAIENFLNEENR